MHLNNVYLDAETQKKYRVLLEDIDFCMLIDTDDKNAWPFKVVINDGYFNKLKHIDDPFNLPIVQENSILMEKREDALNAISLLLEDHIHLFDKTTRNNLISKQLKLTEHSRQYVIRQLRRYWQRGMVPNALAPDYTNSGGKGKVRRHVQNKAGKKRTLSKGSGVIVNDEIASIFDSSITGFYLKNDRMTLVNTYTKSISLYKSRYPNIDESQIPTQAQFKYYYKTNYSEQAALEARSSSIVYNKDIQPLSSTSAYTNFGPGARYEIDATIVDLYLVSEKNSDKIIGRPTIYYVKDVFTRMVVGLYVGLENPSWATAGIALTNAFSDKVKYCKEFDVHIESNEWPSVGLPATVTADRGEMLGTQADVLVNQLGVTLSITRAHRGSDKGIVERAFKEMHASIKPYAEGVVEPLNGMKRTGNRYELDAELSLRDFTKIVIYHVIEHNNTHVISKYDFAPDMPTDLPSIPVKLWNWGIKHRTGRLRIVDEKLIRVNLLPQGKGTVSPLGVKFKGMYYTSPEMIKQGWLHRSNTINRPKSVDIAFDPRNTNIIYLRPNNSYDTYWECSLTQRSRRYQDMTFAEAKGISDQQNKTQAEHKQSEDLTKANYQDKINKVIQSARKKKSNLPPATKTEYYSRD